MVVFDRLWSGRAVTEHKYVFLFFVCVYMYVSNHFNHCINLFAPCGPLIGNKKFLFLLYIWELSGTSRSVIYLYIGTTPPPPMRFKTTLMFTCQYSEQSLCPILFGWHNKIHFLFLHTKIWGLYLCLWLCVHQPLHYSSLGLTCVSCGSRLSTGSKKTLSPS